MNNFIFENSTNHRQYATIVVTVREEEEIIRVLKSMIRGGQLEGVVLFYSKTEDSIIDCLCETGLLYVLEGKAGYLAGREATDYLYGRGHPKIAYLGCDGPYFYSADRQSDYQLSLLQLTSADINSSQLGFEAVSQLINHAENPNLLATKIIVPHHIVARNSCRSLG